MLEALITLIVATSVLLGSPGPAPLALAATSASYGITKTLPFYFGILLGLAAGIIGAIFGVSLLLSTYPSAKLIVQIVGACYLLFVAYKIARGPALESDNNVDSAIPTMLDGFILNLLNPKVYAAFFAIFSHFVLPLENQSIGYFVTAIVCFIIAVIVDYVWMVLGAALKKVFAKPRSARIVRGIFAGVIVLLVILSFLF